jgi:beta-galactosidase
MSYQAVARGAAGVLFFQWRASRMGAEKFHSAMLSHSGTASPVWAEVAGLGRELAGLGSFEGARVQARVAMVLSWANWWAMEGDAKPANDLKMLDQLVWMGRPLYKSATTIDFCRPDEPLGRYGAVIVPSLYLVTEAEGANLVSFVTNGGTAVVSFWSGIVDEHDAVYLGPYGGPLRPLMGCDVLEVAPQSQGDVLEVEWEDGTRTTASFWADVAAEGDGHVLARIAGGAWAGRPVVFETKVGKGVAYYLGARLDNAGLARVYERAPGLAAPAATGLTGSDIERVVRSSGTQSFEFLINHSTVEKQLEIAPDGFDLLTRNQLGNRLVLPPAGVAIIRRTGGASDG